MKIYLFLLIFLRIWIYLYYIYKRKPKKANTFKYIDELDYLSIKTILFNNQKS